MQTFTGRPFWPLDPRPEDLNIKDIAHALSMQCRFAGHSLVFYSVAQHSVYVSELCDSPDALAGLLHDASEAYIMDIPRPLKPSLTGYCEIESKLMSCIADRFGFKFPLPTSVKKADETILANEKRDILANTEWCWWNLLYEPAPEISIVSWSPEFAEKQFLNRFYELS